MKPRLSDLWSFEGTIDRGGYAFWGVALALVKYNLDRVLVGLTTGKFLSPLSYWVPGDLFGVFPLTQEHARAAFPMLVLALPFLWSGIALTLRRLRAVRMPGGSVLLFFVPVVNLLFFAVLCVLPSKVGEGAEARPRRAKFLDRVIPKGTFGSAAMSFLIVLPITTGLAFLSASQLRNYGWGLFVGLPFFLGLASVLIHGYHHPRSIGSCLGVAITASVLLGGLLIALAFEGLICILMAAPLAGALALFGGFVGYLIQRRPEGGRDAGAVVSSLALFLPGLFGVERWTGAEPPLLEVRTAIEVDAPPERVWEHVVAFSELPPPEEMLFRLGIAYPLRAEIEGAGAGAVRHCVFSTGPFVEPIDVWNAPRQLEFSVSAQPPSMRELTPYPAISPPHLEQFLQSHRGRFLLEALPGGRTRLEGTTWYTNRMWPSRYWSVWSDWIIHEIHGRVLEHIRRRAEADGRPR
jgi:uncharacterized membrane protein YhaH (DUF805 family)